MIPTEPQEEFIRSDARFRMFFGSNKIGKTLVGTAEVVSYCLGYRPYLRPDDPKYKTPFKPPIRVRVIGEDFVNHIGKVLVPALREWVPKGDFTFRKGNPRYNALGVQTFWMFNNGSTIELMSNEQETDKFESWDGHLFWFDEPPPYPAFVACMRGGVVHGAHAIITATILKNYWLKNEIWDKCQAGNPDYFAINAEMRSNLRHKRYWYGQLVDTGSLSEENIRKFETLLDGNEAEKEVRVKGGFLYLSGLVLDQLSPERHFLLPENEPTINGVDYTFYEAIDPHPKKPWAVTFLAVSPEGKRYVYDELSIKDTFANIVSAIVAKRQGKPKFTLIDPLAYIKDPNTGKCWADDLKQLGLKVTKSFRSEDAKSQGIMKLNNALALDEIFFFDRCFHHKRQVQSWVWDSPTGKSADKRDASHAIKKEDDFPENLYRLMVHDTRYHSFSTKRFNDTKFKFKHYANNQIKRSGLPQIV